MGGGLSRNGVCADELFSSLRTFGKNQRTQEEGGGEHNAILLVMCLFFFF